MTTKKRTRDARKSGAACSECFVLQMSWDSNTHWSDDPDQPRFRVKHRALALQRRRERETILHKYRVIHRRDTIIPNSSRQTPTAAVGSLDGVVGTGKEEQ